MQHLPSRQRTNRNHQGRTKLKETAREQLNAGTITQDEYFIEYGKNIERIRILDIIRSEMPLVLQEQLISLIKEEA